MSPAYIPSLHDIGILRSDGTTEVGLMLARDPQTKAPIYRTIYDDYFISRAYATEADYGATDPQKEMRLVFSDWRRGMGQYIYDARDTKRYYGSYGCDLRFKDAVTAGYLPATATLPTAPAGSATITNGDMELAANWTEVGTAARSIDQAHAGTYSWEVEGGNSYAYQDAATWNNDWRGKGFLFSCWHYGAAGKTSKIGIDDGIGVTYSPIFTEAAAWSQIKVFRVLDSAATRLRLILYSVSSNVGHYFDDATLTNPAYNIIPSKCIVDFDDCLYFADGNVLLKMNSSGTISQMGCFPANITRLEVFPVSTGTLLMIALGTSNAYWYYSITTSTATLKSTLTKF